MKRLTAILLLLIVLFNLHGYRLVMSFLQQQNSTQVEAQIDRQAYDDAELISIKTTLNLPYYTSSLQFERAYGSIQIDGVEYEYVKRRIYQDTLELLCLPNYNKTALTIVANELAKSATDGASVPAKKSIVLKIVLPNYCQAFTHYTAAIEEISSAENFFTTTSFVSSGYSSPQDKPPRFNA